MANKTDPASISALVGAAVEADPEIAMRVRRLISMQLDHAEWLMKWGSPSDKAMMFRASIPAMMKALQRTEEDADARAQREAVARIYKAMAAGRE